MMRIKVVERLDLGIYATFKPNRELPRHRWFYFKEGFSRALVEYLLKRYKVGGGDWVLDPFTGVGTTPLTCRELGVNTVGVEISPLFKMIAEAKIEDYETDVLRTHLDLHISILRRRARLNTSDIDPLLKKAFPPHSLIDILKVREAIEEVSDRKIRNFFYTALLSAANKASYAIKDGSRIKIDTGRRPPPFKIIYPRAVEQMIRDIENTKLEKSEYHLYQGDARRLTMIEEDSIDMVVTSPPYLNKIEYTTLYEIEYLLIYGDTQVNPVRSYIGMNISRDYALKLGEEWGDLPPGAKAYIQDMSRVIDEIYRVLRRGGAAALVIGQGIYPDRVIPTDRIIAKYALHNGFKSAEIWVVNKRIATRARNIKIGVAEESIVLLRK